MVILLFQEFNARKEVGPSGSAGGPKKKWKVFCNLYDELAFLIPTIKQRETVSNEDIEIVEDDDQVVTAPKSKAPSPSTVTPKRIKKEVCIVICS